MMKKVTIENAGDTLFLQGDRVNRFEVQKVNEEMKNKSVVKDPGDSDYDIGDVVLNENIKDMDKELKSAGKKTIKTTKAKPVTYNPLLLGITRASLNTESFISAASFQETTRVLTDAAVEGKTDYLIGLKENVIIGRLIPARLDISEEGRKRLGLPENQPLSVGAHMGAGNGDSHQVRSVV